MTAPRCNDRTVLVANERPFRTISTEYTTGIDESPLLVSLSCNWWNTQGQSKNAENAHVIVDPQFS